MAGNVRIVPAMPGHISLMVGRLRPDHVAELAERGMTDRAGLVLALRYSVEAWTALEISCQCSVVRVQKESKGTCLNPDNCLADNCPIAMFGLTCPAVLGDLAHPWLITTAATMRHRIRFWREIKSHVAAWLTRYPVLVNEFDRRDGEACRILRHLGFTPADEREPFRTFVLRAT